MLTNVIFDLDYADGIARPNMAFYVFDAAGRLILTSRDSNVADDRPNPTAGSGIPDLTRGSVGVADPYIGNIARPSGVPLTGPQTYFVAVASDARIPDVLTVTTADCAGGDGLVFAPAADLGAPDRGRSRGRRLLRESAHLAGIPHAAGSLHLGLAGSGSVARQR